MGGTSKVNTQHRLHKGKGKRWKKGHSSTSNPEKKAFREAAKSRFFNKLEGPSSLTVDALVKHDKAQGGDDVESMVTESDRQTMGTFKTWATNWTDCTNATFSKVHRYWSSNSALHKEILAVLAAITEVIKTEGGKETETEYFAALMTALESTEGLDSITAIVYLLALVMKRVPVAVLRSKFSEVAKCFLDLMAKYSDGEATSLLKSLIMSLAFLLRSQEAAVWSNSSTQQVYKALLTFITHKKPKTRKAAQQAVCIVLKGSQFMQEDTAPTHHPAAAITAKHCIQTIEATGGIGDAVDTLHTLALVKQFIALLPPNSTKTVCETILKLMTLSNVLVTAAGMQSLHSLFAASPKPECLSAALNAQIINALYDYQPSENDVQPTQAWLVVMETAHINLARLDSKLCINHLPRLFSAGMVCLLSQKTEITSAAGKMLKAVIVGCVAPASATLGVQLQTTGTGSTTPLQKVLRALESGLGYQFHAAWGFVLQVFAAMFQSLGRICPAAFQKSLSAIAELRDSVRFAYKGELDHAVGCAVRAMGPREVLAAIPLQITGQSDDLDFPRSWLLPVIRDNVQETELGFFTSYFLPLAAKLRLRSLELSDQQNIVASKTYETLQLQIWSLLPGFCTRPTDLAISFKGIAKVLGTAIGERDDLRMEVMASLRKLINQGKGSEESCDELGRFSKNFLPILFNQFTTEPTVAKDLSKQAVLETIKCYFQITDKQSIATYCEKCQERLQEKDITAYKRIALHDLLIGMLPYLECEQLRQVFKLAVQNLEVRDRSLQKKSYRMLEEICAGRSIQSREFVRANLPDIQQALLKSLSTSSPSSKAPRLRCLVNIFQVLESRQDEFLLAVVPEAILCTKEIAEKARAASYALLVEMGNSCIRWSGGETDCALEEYFKMVMAGLAGSPQMIGATLLALTRIMYQFKDQMSSAMLAAVLEDVCLLLRSRSREVVKGALAFTKVLVASYPVTTLAQHLKPLMMSLTSMKDDCHHHFRFKSKEVYTKLVKKFGHETIYGMASDSIRKQLGNIRKTLERSKKKHDDKEDSESEDEKEKFKTQTESIDELLRDSDSEPEENQKVKRSKVKVAEKKKVTGGQAWLHEGGDDDITDFMDVSASKKVMATKPIEKKKAQADSGFKTAPDGRLIITESSEDEAGDESDDNDDIIELLDALEKGRDTGKIKQNKKRKLEDLGGSDDEGASPNKYKAGGGGIHRDLDQKKPFRKPAPGAEYRAKKADGDVKKKGKLDPYAYVPLDFRSLNKRKQMKVKGQFSNLVKGAKKGAAKGKKAKRKS
ncbi:RRP12-like protein isoform X6 [Dreissena polymorpha]|uniref:RRP12-like protein isoform X6 n=1 Tax=Dreissena polymorpha TaxID=45954 RepID=UPI00226407FE|nr:RRP12-like protein isoform X6 [Dreissena polymorpha]